LPPVCITAKDIVLISYLETQQYNSPTSLVKFYE
jgi:hypothetical protein